MKAAGIARAVLLATTLTLVGMLFAGVAGAAPLSKQINLYSDELAVDGTDIYSTITRKAKSGARTTVVFRSSFLNNSRAEIARFPGLVSDDIADFSAGGGYVAISVTEEITGSSPEKTFRTSQVVRISRDGSKRDVIASGRTEAGGSGVVVKNGTVVLGDCGTTVRAIGTSDSGSVVIASVVSDRRSKSCGRNKDVDRWRYYEQLLDGSQREIFAKVKPVKYTSKVRGKSLTVFDSTAGTPAVDRIDLVGDRALIRSSSTGRYLVRDLITGALTGPFGLAQRRNERASIGSLSSTGALAMNTFSFKKGGPNVQRIGVYPDAADPAGFRERKGETPLMYCGSHLLSAPSSSSRKLQELDPATFATRRILATGVPTGVLTFGLDISCDDNFLYAIDLEDDEGLKLLAYPLS